MKKQNTGLENQIQRTELYFYNIAKIVLRNISENSAEFTKGQTL